MISSNDARDFPASFAAFPVPFRAFVWAFSAFADAAALDRLFPEMAATRRAICVTTAAMTRTSRVNAGTRTCTSGCARVRSAPLSCAIAAEASWSLFTISTSQVRTLRRAAVIMEKIKTRFASFSTRVTSFCIRIPAVSVASPKRLVFASASRIRSLISPAFFFAQSRSISAA